MPALIALGATLRLRQGIHTRELSLEAFYLGYRQTALLPGEFIEHIHIPLLPSDCHFHTYKVSKRFDQDIAAVCGAFYLELEGGLVRSMRICYGGMAATPQRAVHCEQALVGQPWTEAVLAAAAEALEQDYTPITDMRASSDYRRLVAKHLLRRFYLETSGQVACRVW
jgi:xanthine dehydrogenase small subunit